MTDTTPEVEARLRALYAARSGSARVRMATEMFRLARALIVSDIRRRDPGISDQGLRIRIFERTYSQDLSASARARIVERLGESPPSGAEGTRQGS